MPQWTRDAENVSISLFHHVRALYVAWRDRHGEDSCVFVSYHSAATQILFAIRRILLSMVQNCWYHFKIGIDHDWMCVVDMNSRMCYFAMLLDITAAGSMDVFECLIFKIVVVRRQYSNYIIEWNIVIVWKWSLCLLLFSNLTFVLFPANAPHHQVVHETFVIKLSP